MPYFFFNDTATTEIYTLSLHDALPIFLRSSILTGENGSSPPFCPCPAPAATSALLLGGRPPFTCPFSLLALIAAVSDRKSTRLNSSHANISYAVFCLKKQLII